MIDNSYIVYADWILLIVMFLAFCQQLFSYKFNFYGIVSILSLSFYIAIHSLQSGINMLVLFLFLGAISLIILEMFIPGGIMGVLGIVALIGSIVIINEVTHTITFVIIVSVVLFVLLYLFNIYVLKKKLLFLNRLVLEEEISTEKGYVAKESQIELVGKNLVALTDLRPAGTAILNDVKYDVVTEGDFIEKGNSLIVTQVEGMRIVVRKK